MPGPEPITPVVSNASGAAARTTAQRIAPLFACAAGLVVGAPALAQNAAAGQVLWDTGRSAPTPAVIACATCHGGNGGAANNVTLATIRQRLTNNGGLTVANAQASINRTLAPPPAQGSVPAMIALYPAGALSATDIANLAAFIAQAPAAPPPPPPPPPPPAGVIDATPSTLTFAAAIGGSSAAQTVTVRNGRATAVSFDTSPVVALSTSAAPADFLLSPAGAGSPTTCAAGATLAAGATCTIGILFRPTQAGARTATWELRFATAGVAPVPLALAGTGAPAPAPAPAPSPAPTPTPSPAPAPSPSPTPPSGGAPAGVTNAGAGATGWLALGLLGAAALRRRRP